MPFEAAARTLECLLHVQLSRSTIWRVTRQAGADVQRWQDQQAAPQTQQAEAVTVADRLVMETDGVLVPVRPNEWVEVKLLSIGQVQRQKDQPVHCDQLSYFARLADAETFADLASGEIRLRGIEQAKEVACVQDGAEWIQHFIQGQRADALRILDFAHAAEYISEIGQLASSNGLALPDQWLARELHRLKHEGATSMLEEVERLRTLAPVEGMAEKVAYLRKREGQMQYPAYQAAGWPIGSGAVESGNKLVVQARLKGAGMHWDRRWVNAMLALRTTLCSDRWQQGWQAIQSGWQQRGQKRREVLSSKHLLRARAALRQTLLGFPLSMLLALLPAPPPPVQPLLKGRTQAQKNWGRQTFSPRLLRHRSAKM